MSTRFFSASLIFGLMLLLTILGVTVVATGSVAAEQTNNSVDIDISADRAVAINENNSLVYAIEDGDIVTYDMTTGEQTNNFSGPDGTDKGLAYGSESLWYADAATDAYDGKIVELDPETGDVRSTINTGYDPYGLGFGDGSVWAGEVTGIPNNVYEFDANGNQVGSFDISGGASDDGPNGIAYYNSSVWVGGGGELVAHSTSGNKQETIDKDGISYSGLVGTDNALYGPNADGNLTVIRGNASFGTSGHLSFERASPGNPPVSPWSLAKTGGTQEVSTDRSTAGSQSLYLAGSSGLGQSWATVDVELSDVSTIRGDIYVESGDVYFGDIKVHIDNTDNTIFGATGKAENQWHTDLEGNVTEYDGSHTLILRTRGENNRAYFDNIRFYDKSGDTLSPDEIITDSPATLYSSDNTTFTGSNTTVSFELENTGANDAAHVLNLTLPSGWSVQRTSNDGAEWKGSEKQWLWQTLSPNQTVNPNITLAVPPGTNGTAYKTYEFTEDVQGWETTFTDASNGTMEWSETAGGSVRLHVDGAPSVVQMERSVGGLSKGDNIRVNYTPQRFEYNAAGLHLNLVKPDGSTLNLDSDNDHSENREQNGTMVGTVPSNIPDGTKLQIKLSIWPGSTTVYIGNVSISSNSANNTHERATPKSIRNITGSVLTTQDGTQQIVANTTAEVTVVERTLTVSPAGLILPNGTTSEVVANATQTDGSVETVTDAATYTIANQSVATVNETGTVTAQSTGTTTLTTTYDGASNTTTVTVTEAVPESLTATTTNQTLANGSETALTATAQLTNGTTTEVTTETSYSSNDSSVITVDEQNATLAAESTGTTSVVAIYNVNGTTARDTVSVTVDPAALEEAIDANNDGQIGDTEILTAIDYWQTDATVPYTDDERIDALEILDLIYKWRYNFPV